MAPAYTPRWSVRLTSTLVAVHLAAQRDRAVEQHVEAGRRLALGVDGAPAADALDAAVLGQPVELLVVERLEQEQRRAARPASARSSRRVGHCASR